MKKCLIPGSYDPFTLGHGRIVERALKLFDEVTVLVLVNPKKKYTFSLEERVGFIKKALSQYPGVKVESYCGLLCDYMKHSGIFNVVRGVRNASDYDYETVYFTANSVLEKRTEMVFLPTEQAYSHISSSIVRELLAFHADVSDYLSESIVSEVIQAYRALNH